MSAETKDNVVPMPDRTGKVYNVEYTYNLGKGAQGRIFTDFPQNIPVHQLDEMLDMLDKRVRRQQARYALDELEQELEDREAQMEQWQIDHREAENAFLKTKREIEAKIHKADVEQDAVIRRAAEKHAAAGGRDEYKPSGQVERQIKEQARLKHGFTAEIAKLMAEREQAQSNLEVNIKAGEKQIAKLKAKIALKRAVLEAKE